MEKETRVGEEKPKKKFVRYKTAMYMYEMGRSKIEKVARQAGATYKIDKLVLINTEILDEFLDTYRELPID